MRAFVKQAKDIFGMCLPGNKPVQVKRDAIYAKLNEGLLALSADGSADHDIEPSCEEERPFWHTILRPWVSPKASLSLGAQGAVGRVL